MKTFEISRKSTKNGRRRFKVILHEIYPDGCIDTVNECGTIYNENGITWIKEYCESALPSIKDMSLRAEFLNDERDEICGHGETGIIDGMPVFEDAQVVGHFTKGYIDTISDDGETKVVCIGEGYLDEMCYKNFASKLDEELANGNAPSGSVEIYRTDNNEGIGYLYGYKEKGRIPTEFIYSGYALLGVRAADQTAKILELNSKEEKPKMDKNEIKVLIEQTIEEVTACAAEINQCKKDCDERIAAEVAKTEAVIAEKNEIQANADKIQAALDECRNELSETYKKIDALYEEMDSLREALGDAKAKERLGELNEAISDFSEEEKSYAQAEIDAFKNAPIESEINSVVNKIWEGIGRKAKADASVVTSEKNEIVTVEDIFSEVIEDTSVVEDTNIF